MSKRRYPKMAPEQERALQDAATVQRAADGSYHSRATSKTELEVTVIAARAADCDVSIFVDGLSAEMLAVCAQEVCDLHRSGRRSNVPPPRSSPVPGGESQRPADSRGALLDPRLLGRSPSDPAIPVDIDREGFKDDSALSAPVHPP